MDTPAQYGWHPSNQAPNAPSYGTYGSNSLHQKTKKHHKKHQHKDIGYEPGLINESVHEFASEDTSVLPLPWRRSKVPYGTNGFKNPSW